MKQPPFRANHYYHLYNRGVNRQPIFFQKENWHHFLRQMNRYFIPSLVEIVAYCLMPNHYHILVYLKTDDELSKKIMHPFGTAYTKAINRRHRRVGPLYQGPFRAKHVNDAAYLLTLTRYIHLNPVRAGLVNAPADWPFSSYQEYIGQRSGKLPHPTHLADHINSQTAYRDYVETAVSHQPHLPDSLIFS